MEIQNGNLYIKIVQPLKTVLNVAQNKIDDRKKRAVRRRIIKSKLQTSR